MKSPLTNFFCKQTPIALEKAKAQVKWLKEVFTSKKDKTF